MNVAYRIMRNSDWPGVRALWMRVFGDSEEFVRACAEQFVGFDHIYVAASETEEVLAILSAVPCRVAAREGVYLYGLATKPECRGRGIMTGLMQHAETDAAANGITFAALIPASEELHLFYRERGHVASWPLRHLTWDLGRLRRMAGTKGTDFVMEALAPVPFAQKMAKLQAKWLCADALRFDAARDACVWRDLATQDVFLAHDKGGYAVCLVRDGRLLVAELLAVDDATAAGLLCNALEAKHLMHAEVDLAENSALWPGAGTLRPFARAKALQHGGVPAVPEKAYLRFGMDQV